jgi:GTP-binding protein
MDYSDYVGQIGIGRVFNGKLSSGHLVALVKRDGSIESHKITTLHGFEGLQRIPKDTAWAGEIVAIAGIPDIRVGETIASPHSAVAIPYIDIDQPTISMVFQVNDGPFVGQDGKYTQSRRIRERLDKELQHNVALRVEDTD